MLRLRLRSARVLRPWIEAAHSLSGPAFLRMIHTREGAFAVNLMLTYGGAKQRKAGLFNISIDFNLRLNNT